MGDDIDTVGIDTCSDIGSDTSESVNDVSSDSESVFDFGNNEVVDDSSGELPETEVFSESGDEYVGTDNETEYDDVSKVPDDALNDTEDEYVKVLKKDELDLLNEGNRAINKRLEAQEDDYRDKGFSEDEIQERLESDKLSFRNEFLNDAFPGQDVSPNVFRNLSDNNSDTSFADTETQNNDLSAKITEDNPQNDDVYVWRSSEAEDDEANKLPEGDSSHGADDESTEIYSEAADNSAGEIPEDESDDEPAEIYGEASDNSTDEPPEDESNDESAETYGEVTDNSADDLTENESVDDPAETYGEATDNGADEFSEDESVDESVEIYREAADNGASELPENENANEPAEIYSEATDNGADELPEDESANESVEIYCEATDDGADELLEDESINESAEIYGEATDNRAGELSVGEDADENSLNSSSERFERELKDSSEKIKISDRNGDNLNWTGEVGNSKRIPSDSDSKLASELAKYGVDGIEYKNGDVDFTPVARYECDFPDGKQLYKDIGNNIPIGKINSRDDLNTQIRGEWQKIAKQQIVGKMINEPEFAAEFKNKTGINTDAVHSVAALNRELSRCGLTLHETTDCSKIQFVPASIHDSFKHSGGTAEMLERLIDGDTHLFVNNS